jgi:HJR/Mrr/RecB family endonuclease
MNDISYIIAIIILCVLLLFILITYSDTLFWKDKSGIEYRSLSDLKRMHPFKFEDYIAKLYKNMGYSVKQTKRTGDGGKDIIATKNGQTYFVECKRYSDPVNVHKMRDFVGACVLGGKDIKGIYVTTSSFTNDAKSAANRIGIKMIDGNKLMSMIRSKTR